jgi:GMP synthase-like glutamine amidotransferase
MMSKRARLIASPRGTSFVVIAAVAFLVCGGSLFGQAAAATRDGTRLLPIKNPCFAAEKGAEEGIADWTFESLEVSVDEKTSSFHSTIGKKGEAELLPPGKGGALLKGTTETGRGDLLSAPFAIDPFRWVEVTVEYEAVSGKPVLFVCLRPERNRELVDLDFLPGPGGRRKVTVRLHTGLTQGNYSLALSIMGIGTARFLSVSARETGDYPRPEQPVFVLDMLHIKPVEGESLGWKSIDKLVSVFGFPSVAFLHFTEVTGEKLEEIAPALIVLSPKSENIGRGEVDAIMKALRTTVDYGAPVVGICLGHQVLAMCYEGASLARNVEIDDEGRQRVIGEWGTTKIRILKDDPLFKGLPRRPFFYISESHMGLVHIEKFASAENIASSELCENQVFHYRGKPWYTFQGHIEREWEYSSPAACVLWKNMLRYFFLAP